MRMRAFRSPSVGWIRTRTAPTEARLAQAYYDDSAVQLRPYQHEAVSAVIAARREGVRRMVLALPTGAGKTVIFAELIRRARHPVLVLAHRDELLAQARDKI